MGFGLQYLWIGLVLIAPVAEAQDDSTTSARELFYSPARLSPAAGYSVSTDGKSSAGKRGDESASAGRSGIRGKQEGAAQQGARLGLRYRVLKMNGSGEFVSVPPGYVFHGMDRIRIQLESNRAGYLYVVCRSSDSAWSVLFPSREIRDNRNDVKAFDPLTVPSVQVFVFDQSQGVERIYVVLSEQPEKDLNDLLTSVRSDASRPVSPQVDPPSLMALRETAAESQADTRTRNLLISRPTNSESDSRARDSVYLVNISGERTRVTAEIRLNHE